MTKQEKIALLPKLMTESERPDGSKFYHFAFDDEATKELRDKYLTEYEVRDQDYETFSQACDLLAEIYNDEAQENDGLEFVEDAIYDSSREYSSVYNDDRLAYLNVWNQEDITDIVRNSDSSTDISTACAIWYERRIEEMALFINRWINA